MLESRVQWHQMNRTKPAPASFTHSFTCWTYVLHAAHGPTHTHTEFLHLPIGSRRTKENYTICIFTGVSVHFNLLRPRCCAAVSSVTSRAIFASRWMYSTTQFRYSNRNEIQSRTSPWKSEIIPIWHSHCLNLISVSISSFRGGDSRSPCNLHYFNSIRTCLDPEFR